MAEMKNLILASQSPRRKELLAKAGFEFTVTSLQISEIPDENLNLTAQIEDLAKRKAEACLETGKIAQRQGNLLLSADTVVILDDKILGKPKDQKENRQFIVALSGRWHEVITAVCLVDVDSTRLVLAHEISRIEFHRLSSRDIDAYIDSGDGLDKAGGYGIQNAIAGKFVATLAGDFDNVMGLPVKRLEQLLAENGWHVARRSPSST